MSSEDVDGLVGRGEKLMKDENWEEAVRVFDRAFEASGRSSQDVSRVACSRFRLCDTDVRTDAFHFAALRFIGCQPSPEGSTSTETVEGEGLLQGASAFPFFLFSSPSSRS